MATRAVVPPADADDARYLARRFAGGMRYAPPAAPVSASTVDSVAAGAEEAPLTAAPLAFAPEPVAPVPAAASDRSATRRKARQEGSPHRPALAWSHRFAAVAAVSGLALAVAYPATTGDGNDAERVAHQSAASVADVTVPASEDFSMVKASVTSSFTKDDQLSYLMSASGGDISTIDTHGVLAQPVDHVRITSPFGARANPTGEGAQVHIGQDYGIACGSPVKAAASGTVVQAGWAGHSGNRVRIDHGNGLETTYNHNTSLKVSVGQKVERGDVVSLSGTTGNSTGCHLHFEVLVDGDAVNPAGWL
ncbi:MAG TPA: peptidoglycan DD-metalloendopeptidase family protein [Arthrobacter sp.]|nr:peptidoglycan DD-metalloendopeptidase family protein [Arthrobacter sp.]